MIVSRNNRRIKNMRRLKACKDERALLDEPDLVGEALAAGLEVEEVLVTPDFLAGAAGRRLAALLPVEPVEVAPELLAEVADVRTPQGVVAAVRLPRPGVEGLPRRPGAIYLYLDGLQDPGNLGALVRVAEAAGAAGVALSPGCAHPNHPRALRGSAGSLLRLPTAAGVAAEELERHLSPLSPRWLALVPRGGEDLWAADLAGALVLALGAEGPGLSPGVAARAGTRLTIPLAPPVESLNATVAAALVLFERRRRGA
jgi:TrmH family RNA methyltransferase